MTSEFLLSSLSDIRALANSPLRLFLFPSVVSLLRPDGPKFSPGDKEKSRVFVFNEHAWWGALITGPGKKTPKGDWVYSCKLVHGKILKAVKEDKITARDQLPVIHDQVCPFLFVLTSPLLFLCPLEKLISLFSPFTRSLLSQPWGTYKSLLVSPITQDDLSTPFHHARSRPSTPDPTDESSSRPFEDLSMWQQLERCRPTLERIIKGEYPPAVKAHREATSTGGLRLNMARDAVGYGSLADREVEESVLPELQRWALRNQGPEEVKVVGEDGTETMVSFGFRKSNETT